MMNLEYDGIKEGYTYDDSNIYYNGKKLDTRKSSRGNDYIKIRTQRGLYGITLRNALNIIKNGRQVCSKCGEDKPLDEYYWKTHSVFGKEYVCKQCTKKRVSQQQKSKRDWKNWYKEDTQELREKNRKSLMSLRKPLKSYLEARRTTIASDDDMCGVWETEK
jgi:hypothetical protein